MSTSSNLCKRLISIGYFLLFSGFVFSCSPSSATDGTVPSGDGAIASSEKATSLPTAPAVSPTPEYTESRIWSLVGLEGKSIYSLAVDPNNPDHLLAGVRDEGLYRTIDGGQTWNLVQDFNRGEPSAIAFHPHSPNTVFIEYGNSIYRSVDGGETWERVHNEYFITDFAFDPIDPSVIYASEDSYILKSVDGGDNWSRLITGVVFGQSSQFYTVAVHPEDPSIVFAGGFPGVYKSQDGGVTWESMNEGLSISGPVTVLEFDPNPPYNAYAGGWTNKVHRYKAGEVGWSILSTVPKGEIYGILFDGTKDPSMMYFGAWRGGVFYSLDGGVTVKRAGKNLPDDMVFTLIMDPTNPSILYAGMDGSGVWKYS